jgi:hypothetical protein
MKSTVSHPFFLRSYVNIIHASTPRSTKWSLTFRFPLTINILQTCLFSCSPFQNSADSPHLTPSAICLARRTPLNFLTMQYPALPSHFANLIKCQLNALCFRTLVVSIRKIAVLCSCRRFRLTLKMKTA